MPFLINQMYDFDTYAPTILGGHYTNMKVKGIVSFDDAIKHADVATIHESVKAVIPGLPPTPNDLIFIIFVDTTGAEVTICKDYINPAITQVTTININISINGISSALEPVINLRLQELGISNFVITRV